MGKEHLNHRQFAGIAIPFLAAALVIRAWGAGEAAAPTTVNDKADDTSSETNWLSDLDGTQDVVVDTMVQPAQWFEGDPREVDDDVRMALRFSTNGHPEAWCRIFDGESIRAPAWLQYKDVHIASNQWVRLTVSMSHTPDGLHDYFRVQFDGKAAKHHYGFVKPDPQFSHIGTHNGEWFLCAKLRSDTRTSFGFSGEGQMESFTATNRPVK